MLKEHNVLKTMVQTNLIIVKITGAVQLFFTLYVHSEIGQNVSSL